MSSLQSGDNAEPNLVPILDMVFQLITFFMLVMNFKSAEMDLNLKLPVVGSAKPVESKPGDEKPLVLNIDSEGRVKVTGQVQENIAAFAAFEGNRARTAIRKQVPDFKDGADLQMPVAIRCDKDTRFSMVYRVIKEFQQQGFRNFHYMTHIPE